jgi:hypothetical protein
VQTAVVEIGLQDAPCGHTVPSSFVISSSLSFAEQMSAHCDGVVDGGFSRTHWGAAVVPAGMSVGHGDEAEHVGEQKLPFRPVMVVLLSPLAHGPLNGLP